jgi:hypothetical protein
MIVQTGELTVRSYKTKTPITPPFVREVAFRSDNAYPPTTFNNKPNGAGTLSFGLQCRDERMCVAIISN